MSENDETPTLPGYMTVKEAADRLNVSDQMIYFRIESKRLHAVRAGNLWLIPTEEVENFEYKSAGRPRTRTPGWRMSAKDNTLIVTSIKVHMRAGKLDQLTKKLAEIRRRGTHEFVGTVGRYLIEYEQSPNTIEILLIWKKGTAPDPPIREAALQAFRQELADLLDWATAEYNHGTALMHT